MFKIGDVVECIDVEGIVKGIEPLIEGKKYTISSINDRGTYISLNDFPTYVWHASNFILAKIWIPKPGEMIKVSHVNNFKVNFTRKFVGMHSNGLYICEYEEGIAFYSYARKISTHIVTFDEKEVEISEESFNNFKESFLKNNFYYKIIDLKELKKQIMDYQISKPEKEWWLYNNITKELQDFAIWMTECGYDFYQHEYFQDKRDKLLKNKKD
jgi:hypothetical protein